MRCLPVALDGFDGLVGLSWAGACDMLGYWWRLDYTDGDKHVFVREPLGRVELRTVLVDGVNVVGRVYATSMSARYLPLDGN